jgi:hypothetical protein
MAESASKERSDSQSTKKVKAQRGQVSTENEDIRARIAQLETERIKKATQEIQAVLDKYGVMLQAVAEIPASRINVVSRFND